MVRKVKKWLGIDLLERENLTLVRAVAEHEKRLNNADENFKEFNSTDEDHEVRITFCEKSLTPKSSEPKIVPKAQKKTFRQFAEAASRATEENPE